MFYKRILIHVVLIFCLSAIMISKVPCTQADMMVYDANGQFIGFSDNTSYNSVYNPFLDALVDFRIDEDIYDSQNPTAYYGDVFQAPFPPFNAVYESNDCSGTAYIYDYYATTSKRVIFKQKDNPGYLLMYDHKNKKRFIPKSIQSTSCRPLTDSDVVQSLPYSYKQISTPLHYTPILSFQGTFPFSLPIALPLQYNHINSMDVNGDGKTGLVEAIYSLQKTAGMR